MIIKKTDQERYSEFSRQVVRRPIWRLSNLIRVLNLRLLVTGSVCSYFLYREPQRAEKGPLPAFNVRLGILSMTEGVRPGGNFCRKGFKRGVIGN